MPIARFQMPDGRVARFEVPEGTTPEQAQVMIQEAMPKQETPQPVQAELNRGTMANIGMGALKGASDIGATLLKPVDYVLNKTGLSDRTNEQRRQSMADFFAQNADPDSVAFKGGELGAGIAGTAGAGGVIAKGLRAIPALASKAPSLINAVESGGLSLGKPAATTLAGNASNLATRSAGGAVLGGVSAGMIDPDTAGTGAVIGGAFPGGMVAAKAVGGGIKNAAGWTGRNAIGAMTGTGAEAVKTAFNAGKSGNQTFLKNMRGEVDMTDVLDDAKSALGRIREERSAAYKSGMFDIQADKTVLDMAPVMKAADDAMADTMFKGVVKKENAAKMSQKMKEVIDEWTGLNPAEYHTPEGLDALKQRIGDLRDGTAFGSPERRAADSIYNSIKRQIQDQAPTYSKVMKEYSEASELIGEIERSLVGKEKTSADTAMRKLQSLMRNNVNTNYGNRLDLAKQLEARGADILPAVAGQSMSSMTPRGLQGLAATGTSVAGLANPAFLAALPFQSPRIMGEVAYGLGKGAGKAGAIPQALLSNPVINRQITNPRNYGLLAVPPVLMSTNP